MERPPRLVLTGAAGFLGKRVIERLSGHWQIEAVDREPPVAGMLVHRPEVRWHRIDLTDDTAVTSLFTDLRGSGGATAVLHLAAHYDFSGERHPNYQRTNVEGRAACSTPATASASSVSSSRARSPPAISARRPDARRSSPPDGDQRLCREQARRRSDDARREPLPYRHHPLRGALLGLVRIRSALLAAANLALRAVEFAHPRRTRPLRVPYLHVRDAGVFAERLLDLRRELEPAEVLIASPNRVTSHADLFRAVTAYVRGAPCVRSARRERSRPWAFTCSI